MIDRPNPIQPHVRAGSEPARPAQPPRSWIHDRAPRLRTLTRERQRREHIWAWLSLATLVLCWDVSSRLEERVSPPRVRIAHALDQEESPRASNAAMITTDL